MQGLFRIQNTENTINIEESQYEPGRGRALNFFTQLSHSLSQGKPFSNFGEIEKFHTAINFVHSKVKKNFIYRLTYWIPGTTTHKLFQLIKNVRKNMSQQKATLVKNAEMNTTNAFALFKTSPEMIKLCTESYRRHAKNGNILSDNYAILYFSEEENKISASPDNFRLRTGLTPFVVSFKENDQLIKLTRVREYPQILKAPMADYAAKHIMMFNSHYQKIHGLLLG